MPVVQFCNVCFWTDALWISLRLLKLGLRLGQVQSCKPPEEEEEVLRTVKSHASDTWLSHISPPTLPCGKNVGLGWDCTWTDLNLNSPGLALHYPVCLLLSHWPKHRVCKTRQAVHWITGQFRSGSSRGDILKSRAADGKKFRVKVGSITVFFPLQADLAGDLGVVVSLPLSENAQDYTLPFLGLSVVLTRTKGKPVCQLHLM